MTAVIEIAVTSGRGWAYDPESFDRAFGGGMRNPHRRAARVPLPAVVGDYDSVTYGGHIPGPNCTTRTCGWMNSAIALGCHV